MEFTQRVWAQLVLRRELQEMYGERFEGFFHRLMETVHPGYSPVRTHASAGGLSLYDRTLYAFHAPAVGDPGQLRSSFRGALRGVGGQGGEQFDAFVFVHNDARGAYPEFGDEVEAAAEEIQPVELQHRDAAWLVRRFRELDQQAVEELLEQEVPAPWDARRGVTATELEPLLAGLPRRRPAAPDAGAPDAGKPDAGTTAQARAPSAVSPYKLAYHAFPDELRDAVLGAMRCTHLVDAFFAGSSDAGEHDAVAEGFRYRFRELRDTAEDPEDLWLGLQEHVLGGAGMEPTPELAGLGSVLITHFFERCDLFDAPPEGWAPRSAAPRSATSGSAVPRPRRPR